MDIDFRVGCIQAAEQIVLLFDELVSGAGDGEWVQRLDAITHGTRSIDRVGARSASIGDNNTPLKVRSSLGDPLFVSSSPYSNLFGTDVEGVADSAPIFGAAAAGHTLSGKSMLQCRIAAIIEANLLPTCQKRFHTSTLVNDCSGSQFSSMKASSVMGMGNLSVHRRNTSTPAFDLDDSTRLGSATRLKSHHRQHQERAATMDRLSGTRAFDVQPQSFEKNIAMSSINQWLHDIDEDFDPTPHLIGSSPATTTTTTTTPIQPANSYQQLFSVTCNCEHCAKGSGGCLRLQRQSGALQQQQRLDFSANTQARPQNSNVLSRWEVDDGLSLTFDPSTRGAGACASGSMAADSSPHHSPKMRAAYTPMNGGGGSTTTSTGRNQYPYHELEVTKRTATDVFGLGHEQTRSGMHDPVVGELLGITSPSGALPLTYQDEPNRGSKSGSVCRNAWPNSGVGSTGENPGLPLTYQDEANRGSKSGSVCRNAWSNSGVVSTGENPVSSLAETPLQLDDSRCMDTAMTHSFSSSGHSGSPAHASAYESFGEWATVSAPPNTQPPIWVVPPEDGSGQNDSMGTQAWRFSCIERGPSASNAGSWNHQEPSAKQIGNNRVSTNDNRNDTTRGYGIGGGSSVPQSNPPCNAPKSPANTSDTGVVPERVWEDDLNRMVFISWVPRQVRASNIASKRRAELALKRLLRTEMGVEGLSKVLLFPPKGTHCKLVFDSTSDAADFVSLYGGDFKSSASELWKTTICQCCKIQSSAKFDSTSVVVEWAQRNPTGGLGNKQQIRNNRKSNLQEQPAPTATVAS